MKSMDREYSTRINTNTIITQPSDILIHNAFYEISLTVKIFVLYEI